MSKLDPLMRRFNAVCFHVTSAPNGRMELWRVNDSLIPVFTRDNGEAMLYLPPIVGTEGQLINEIETYIKGGFMLNLPTSVK